MDDRKILMEVGRVVWGLSERLHIPLGRFAPDVFGWMVGGKAHKCKKKPCGAVAAMDYPCDNTKNYECRYCELWVPGPPIKL